MEMRAGRTGRTGIRNTARALALGGLLALASLSLLVAPAKGAITHPLIGSFGPDGTAASKFPKASGEAGLPGGNLQLAFDQAGDRLLVAMYSGILNGADDSVCGFASAAVEPWSPVGSCIDGFKFSAGAIGSGVAVDNSGATSASNVYVLDNGGSPGSPGIGVHGFPPSGGTAITSELAGFPRERETPLFYGPFGLAVDSIGRLWVADNSTERIVKLNSSGTQVPPPLNVSAQGQPLSLALDSEDNLYVTFDTPSNSPGPYPGVYKYTAASNYTTAVLIDPGDTKPAIAVAVDRSNDHLFVAHTIETAEGLGGANDVAEYDVSGPSASLVSTFATGLTTTASPSGFRGIAVDEKRQQIFVSNGSSGQIHVFSTELTEPVVATLAASDRSATSVTANGTVNPKGKALNDCRFEYVTETAFQQSGFSELSSGGSAPCAESVPADEAAHPVSAALSGLIPATRYRYRLLASSSEGTGVDKGAAFATLGPLLSGAKAAGVKYTTANLFARVNPQGQSTSYHFEYVTDAACQADVEAEGPGHCFDNAALTPESGSVGSDENEHPISAALTGLAEGTPYRFRAVAANSDATGIGDEAAFTTHTRPAPVDPGCPNAADRTGPSEALPECRAYEQVSPLEKGSANASYTSAQAAVAGDSLVFSAPTLQVFPGSPGSAAINHYLARRDIGGNWSTESLTTGLAAKAFNAIKFSYLGFAEDLSHGAICTGASLEVPGDGDGLYLRDNLTASYEEVPGTNSDPQTGTCGSGTDDLLASPDYDRVVFQSPEALTPDAPILGSVQRVALYEWHAGSLSLFSRDPAGTPIPGIIFPYREHAVSTDGERIFWGSGAVNAQSVYARIGSEETVNVGLSERSPKDPGGARAKTFVEASADGDAVFFVSGEKLTADSTATEQTPSFAPSRGALVKSGELYRYDFAASEGERLTDVTVAPGEPKGAQVQGVIDASADGERIYFVALGDLAPGAVSGQPNLYLWDGGGIEPTTTHIATLAPASSVDKDNLSSYHGVATPMATPSGERLLFLSTARLTGYDNANRAMLYLYDASSDTTRCLSCHLSGEAASASAALGEGHVEGPTSNLRSHQRRNLSADGTRVFFETADSLLPADTNGRVDVYEWLKGGLHLISTGQSSVDSHFVDASATGDDVFFATREKLSPLDEDSQFDVYDARVNGIAADPRPPRAECLGEACQPSAIVPTHPTPASSGFRGAGNPSPAVRRRCPKGKRKARRAGRVRCIPKRKRNAKRGHKAKRHHRVNYERGAGR